jgi:pimeloyl-ACP methyl ester carboxylesterase
MSIVSSSLAQLPACRERNFQERSLLAMMTRSRIRGRRRNSTSSTRVVSPRNTQEISAKMEWKDEQLRMVGDPTHASRIVSPCEMKNEWPSHLWPHFEVLLASDKSTEISKGSVAKLTVPVLTIHGRKDRNAPYGGGREWNLLLPNARLITIEGAAHMSWVEFPDIVFPSIELFLSGQWPDRAEKVKTLELPSIRAMSSRN